jgi:hypothetical protein
MARKISESALEVWAQAGAGVLSRVVDAQDAVSTSLSVTQVASQPLCSVTAGSAASHAADETPLAKQS